LAHVIVAVARSQQNSSRADFLGLAEAAERKLRSLPSPIFVAERVVQPRIDRARGDRVDKNVVRRGLMGERSRKADQSRLGRTIVGETGSALKSTRRKIRCLNF
jgi:hypothetical protein